LLLAIGAAAWYVLLTDRFGQGRAAPAPIEAEPGTEICEFLARPAAKLFIDGKQVAEEIPPVYRLPLPTGRHAVRFEGPGGVAHEMTINVVAGNPRQWFVNLVDGKVRVRKPLTVGGAVPDED
jgi:hypothetical protein